MKVSLRPKQKAALFLFFLLAFIFTWSNWIPQALVSRGYLQIGVPKFLAFVAGYGPALAAIITIAIFNGAAGLKNFFRRLVLWKVSIVWYMVALLLPSAMSLTAFSLHMIFDSNAVSAFTLQSLQNTLSQSTFWNDFLMLSIMFMLGFDGLGEELGWRGFALPILLINYKALVASIILGFFWALWHLPYALTLNSAMSGQSFYSFIPGILASSILFTWIFNNTKGSILLSILFHAANNINYNLLPKLFPEVHTAGIWNTIIPWFVVLLVIIYFGPSHLSKNPENMPNWSTLMP
jgi:membrane protease YdiL (CAAX protease family)